MSLRLPPAPEKRRESVDQRLNSHVQPYRSGGYSRRPPPNQRESSEERDRRDWENDGLDHRPPGVVVRTEVAGRDIWPKPPAKLRHPDVANAIEACCKRR